MAGSRTLTASLIAALLDVRIAHGRRARLVAISGIDASGKGHVSALLAEGLARIGFRVALVAADGWLNLPDVRFGGEDPGEYFYRHAFRFDEMFSRLIEPLACHGSCHLIAEYAEETATRYREHVYEFENVDFILLEGIFLFKREHQQRYDFRIWIDCSFETALERAIARSQEGLSSVETITAYERIYFPAERVHFERDRPRDCADLVYVNDEHGSAGVIADGLKPTAMKPQS